VPWFRSQSGPDRAQQADAAERDRRSQAELAAGRLPLQAQERLQQQAQGAAGWTSDLAADELAALHQVGFEPVGQVLGSTIYRISALRVGLGGGSGMGLGGFAYSTGATENTVLSQALYESRRLAIGRLVQEASGLGAHGVVGVRLTIRAYDWGQGMAEFSALGTAVRRRGAAPLPQPFTSDLSGQEFAKLVRAGWIPVGLVLGACAMQAVVVFNTMGMGMGWGSVSSWWNQEVTPFTAAIHQALQVARQRMRAEGAQLGADGIVGVNLSRELRDFSTGSESVQGRLVEWVAAGTAVAAYTAAHRTQSPQLVVPLTDRADSDLPAAP